MNPRRALGVVCLAAVSSLIACWGNDPTATDGPHNVQVVFRNQDTQPVHLFAVDAGETFPCCRLDVGQSRQVAVTANDKIVVRAGRNGEELNTTTCKVFSADLTNPKNITWRGTNGWLCT